MVKNRTLEEHGTTAFVLKPGSVADAAIEDIRRHFRNKASADGRYEQYAFLQKHVHQAIKKGAGVLGSVRAKELIRLAIDHRSLGESSGKHLTRMIYNDLELLAGALVVTDEKIAIDRKRRADPEPDPLSPEERAHITATGHMPHDDAD